MIPIEEKICFEVHQQVHDQLFQIVEDQLWYDVTINVRNIIANRIWIQHSDLVWDQMEEDINK